MRRKRNAADILVDGLKRLEAASASAEEKAAVKRLEAVYQELAVTVQKELILLIVGIGLGAVISVGVVKALNQLGLTEKTKPALPDSLERKLFDPPS